MLNKLLELNNYFKNSNFEDALHKYKLNNKVINKKNILNFRNKLNLSFGFDEAHKKKMGKKILKNLSQENIQLLRNLKIPNIGNCNFLIPFIASKEKKYKIFNTDAQMLYDFYLLDKIKNNINLPYNNKILAIGEGFGMFCALLSKFLIYKQKKFKFVIFELPLQNILLVYYLKKMFPKKTFLTPNIIKNNYLKLDLFNKYDFIIITPDIKLDKRIKFSLIYSKMSLMNMTYSSIKYYFSIINLHLKKNKYLFLVNKYKKKKFYIFNVLKYLYNYKIILSLNSKFRYDQHIHLFKKKKDNNLKNLIEIIYIFIKTLKLIIINKIRFIF